MPQLAVRSYQTISFSNNIYPTYLAVDFDLGWTGEKIKNQQECFNTIQLLLNNKYRILHNEGPEYSFMLQ